MTRKKTPRGGQIERRLYEIVGRSGKNEVTVRSQRELRDALTKYLPEITSDIDQAVAHICYAKHASITSSGWSIKYVGDLDLKPIDSPVLPSGKRGRKNATNKTASIQEDTGALQSGTLL